MEGGVAAASSVSASTVHNAALPIRSAMAFDHAVRCRVSIELIRYGLAMSIPVATTSALPNAACTSRKRP